MSEEKCPNNNHSRMNVPVRYCPSCGETVGKAISHRSCSADAHAKRRKDRSKFCVDCGKPL